MSFIAALRFLTSIPFPWRREASPEELGRSIVYFPLVGIIIGLVLAGLGWLLGLVLPLSVVEILLIVFLAIVTGLLHLDGLADTCDGLARYKTVEARWQAMRDSRVGGFGVIGVSLLLLTKYVSLNSIPESSLTLALILMPVVSRWAMVYAIFTYPYARPSGLGRVFKQEATPPRFTLATVITLGVAVVLTQGLKGSYLSGLVIMGAAWLMVMLLAAYLSRKFAGLTGDNYGALNEIAEVSVLILIGLLAHNRWLGMA